MLKVEHIHKQYGGFTALSDVSFAVSKGQILGLLGRNGAGKSSLMNVITGYLAPTSGWVLWEERDIRALGAQFRSELGYLPEIPPLYPALTVEEYLDFVCGLKRIRSAARRAHIAQVCEMVRIDDRRGQLIRKLSKGYRQRVGMAQALIGNPELLIFDEPMVGLDPEQIAAIREVIRELGRDHAVILSSHILSEIENICNSLLILRKGCVVAQGTMSEIAFQARSDNFRLRVRAQGKNIAGTLSAIPGVTEVFPLEERESGYEEYRVTSAEDVSERVPGALIEQGIRLRMLYPLDVDLEDVFLNLTREGENA